MSTTTSAILAEATKWVGTAQYSAAHTKIVDTYNANRSKSSSATARGYAVKSSDDWCDVFVSFLGIQTGAIDLIDIECGVDRHIQLFKNKGIWNEDGTITPKAGDIITFNWDTMVQQNDGFADHIGIVEKVVGSTVYTIEGNTSRSVNRRSYPVGWGYIRGYARPKYGSSGGSGSTTTTTKSVEEIAKEVIADKWGKDPARSAALTAAGYNAAAVQAKVNELFGKSSSTTTTPAAPAVTGQIATIQKWLNSNYNSGLTVDNSAGALTKKAIVKAVQTEMNKQYGSKLVVDGSFGSLSKGAWKAFKQGTSGNLTRLVQAILYAKGFDPKGFDGSFGSGCDAAVRAYQKAKGLTVDGWVGQQTASSLFS